MERRRGRRQERGQKGWTYKRLLLPTDTQALRDFSLGLQRRENWNSALPEIRTRIRVLCQEEVISFQSSAQAEGPLTRFLRPGPGEGLEKQGRIERVKERKERGRGERSIKSLVPYQSGHSGQLSTLGGDQGQKGPSCDRWPLSTLSGQDVSLSQEESPPDSQFVAGSRTPSRA